MAEAKFKLLEVDLTHGKTNVVDVTEDMRRYLGGRGLGAKLIWDRVPPGADPLGPQNILYFGVGPVTGFAGSVINVNSKSPLTSLRGHSSMNGHVGVELIYAGYGAGLLLQGKAPKPVYLYIKDDNVEIRDASHLWGRLNLETQQVLHQELRGELDDQNFRIVSIGPAGERLVRNASITHDFYHHAARLGMGAVMGSKNVKAIAVRGTRPPEYANPQRLFELMNTLFSEGRLQKAMDRRFGHSASIAQRYYQGLEGVKNKQLAWDPICDLSNPLLLEQRYKLWSDSCTLCHIGCKVPFMRREPPLGPCAGEMRHDNAGGWSANVMLPGYDAQVYLTPFLDELGLDSEDVSGLVAWLMECYQRGLVTKDDLDGLELTWGNLEATSKLVKKIAFREGVGDILAEGLKFASSKIGRGSERYAMTHKGVAITSYEPRGSMVEAVGLAVVPSGEIHGGRGNPNFLGFESLTTCLFYLASIPSIFGTPQWGTEMVNAATGWSLTIEEWNNIIRRIFLMERCYSLREGHVPAKDDTLPDRFFEETVSTKYGKKLILEKNEFLAQREKWYLNNGLSKDGLPTKAELDKLGIGSIVPILEEKGIRLA